MRLEVRGLTKAYAGKEVLHQVSLTVEEGEGLCLMGPSGCGKTTLFRILLGLEKADEGTVQGIDRSAVSAVFQEDRLLEAFSAVENVWLVCGRGVGEEKIREALSQILPWEALDQPVRQLSGGMKRRVALVRAMMKESELIVMDEPFTGLDEETKQCVIRYLKKERKGRTFLISTHQEEDARMLDMKIMRLRQDPCCIHPERE